MEHLRRVTDEVFVGNAVLLELEADVFLILDRADVLDE